MTDHRKEAERRARLAAAQAIRDYKSQNPEAARLAASVRINVFGKRPKGYRDIPTMVAQLFILDRKALLMTNQQIASWLSERLNGYAVSPNVLCRSLPPSARKAISELMVAAGRVPDLQARDTLSKIKKRWAAHAAVAGTERCGTVTVAFTDEAVVIDNKRYPVTVESGYRRVRSGKRWVRADVLEQMLLASEP